MRKLLLRLALLVPWVFLIWLIGQGISGEISALLVFILLFILIPVAMFLNVVTMVFFQGQQFMKQVREMQKARTGQSEPLESENYADLPKWDPRKYKK